MDSLALKNQGHHAGGFVEVLGESLNPGVGRDPIQVRRRDGECAG